MVGGRNVLPCDLAKLGLALWALLVRITNSVHDHLRVDARAITVDLVGELVVYEEEDHEVTANTCAIWERVRVTG
jgi:hypothetical protein